MHTKCLTAAVMSVILGVLSAGPVTGQDIVIGKMELDKVEWGIRKLYIPVDNLRDDTAYLNVIIHTVYPAHYLSGIDRLTVDTTLTVAPFALGRLEVPFEIPGSFGRAVSRAVVFWRYKGSRTPPGVPDSTFQMFSTVFYAQEDATPYADRKHCIGPAYAMIDYFDMNFEYPRLILFLLARGENLDAINSLFDTETDYTGLLVQRLRDQGFFPFGTDSLVPGVLAIEEGEGYAIKSKVKDAGEAFATWYENTGGQQLDDIFAEVGLEPYTRELPALRMPILLTLLRENWVDTEHGFGVPQYEDMKTDLRALTHPRWFVQGGEYFMPKLCLAAFEENGRMHLGTFSPDPALPFDKAPIYDLRRAVEEAAGSLILVDARQIRDALARARQQNLAADVVDRLREIIPDAQTDIQRFAAYQTPYLADYIIRVILGDYFVDQGPSEGLDCIQVEY